MATKKELADYTDRELMEKIADNTRRSADSLGTIRYYALLLIVVTIIAFAFSLGYLQHA